MFLLFQDADEGRMSHDLAEQRMNIKTNRSEGPTHISIMVEGDDTTILRVDCSEYVSKDLLHACWVGNWSETCLSQRARVHKFPRNSPQKQPQGYKKREEALQNKSLSLSDIAKFFR